MCRVCGLSNILNVLRVLSSYDKLFRMETTDLIKKYEFKIKKKFGQNFLIDGNILNGIADAADVGPDDTVLEIGPGLGALTRILAQRARKVIAIEIDDTLIPILGETLAEYSNVRIVNDDVLKVDIASLLREEGAGSFKVVANLPYYITTPIIMNLLERELPTESITVMVQREVADRMCAKPGGKDYGALTLAVQYYSDPEIVLNVSPGCFIPRPEVGSAVVRMVRYDDAPCKPADPGFMFDLIRASFNHRRKTLANGVIGMPALGISREQVYEALKKMDLPEQTRGETLSVEQFAQLSDLLKK